MDYAAREKWDERYATQEMVFGAAPDPFLVEQVGDLEPGSALCLAAGEGRNAVYLAQRGYDVTALDISARGLEKGQLLAVERGVEITTVHADAMEYAPDRGSYDLVISIFFLERALFPGIVQALKPGGRLLVHTYSREQLRFGWGPSNPDFLLGPNELLETFKGFRIRYYAEVIEEREEGRQAALVRLVVENQPVAQSV